MRLLEQMLIFAAFLDRLLRGNVTQAFSYLIGLVRSVLFKLGPSTNILLLLSFILAIDHNHKNSYFNDKNYVNFSRQLGQSAVKLWSDIESKSFFCYEAHKECKMLVESAIKICYSEPFSEGAKVILADLNSVYLKGLGGVSSDYILDFLIVSNDTPECYRIWSALDAVYPVKNRLPPNVAKVFTDLDKDRKNRHY